MIPNEDDISKTQLWERIDAARSAAESHRKELDERIDGLVGALQIKMATELERAVNLLRASNRSFLDGIHEEAIVARREAADVNRLNDEKFEKATREQEKRLGAFVGSVPLIVKKEAADLFADVTIRVRELGELVAKFEKSISSQLSQSLIEMRGQVGMVDKKLEEVLSKLRRALKDL